MIIPKILSPGILLLLGACSATLGNTSGSATMVSNIQPTRTVVSPQDKALSCLAQIDGVSSLRIAINAIDDGTGKINVSDSGTGNFISQGLTNQFFTSFSNIGVTLIDYSAETRQMIDFLEGKGVQPTIRAPQFLLAGGFTAFDTTSSFVSEFIIGRARSYSAIGRMDVRLTTLPFGDASQGNLTIGGLVVSAEAVMQEFNGSESEVGIATFVGNGLDIQFISAMVGSSGRDPIQFTTGYMADFAAYRVVYGLIYDLSANGSMSDQRAALESCDQLLYGEHV